MKTINETQLQRGRCFSIEGASASQVQNIVKDCLRESGFHSHTRHRSPTTVLMIGSQRASWYRVLLSALPQRLVFEIRTEPEDRRVHLMYDEQLAPWYLAVLVVIAAIMTRFWLGSLAMLFRFASVPTQLQDFSAAQMWASGAVGLVFVRLMLASGAGTTIALLEEIRARARHVGASIDQQETGTITTKLLISILFLCHILSVLLLGTFSALSPFSSGVFGRQDNLAVTLGAVGLLLLVAFSLVRGSSRTIKPIGGEERFAMLATGVSVQLGVVLLLGAQLAFLLLGQSTDELWAMVFHAARILDMDAGQLRAAGLEHFSRERFEIAVNMFHAFGHTLMMAAAAPACIGAILILRSVRLAPHVRRMCERVHGDIESDYGRAAASGEVFRHKSRRSFLLAWGLSAVVIAVGLYGLLQFGIAGFEFGYAGRTPDAAMGAVDAVANLINLLAGFQGQSYIGPVISRAFFICWTAAMVAPVAFLLYCGWQASLHHRRHLMALSDSVPTEATELDRRLDAMASRLGLSVRLAISPGQQPRAAAHRVGVLRSHKFVEVSERCLELLDAEEQEALVAHELGHHLHGHCWKHDIMQWLGCMTYVGGTYVTSMEDSYGFEMQADRVAVERLGIDPASLRSCLMKMRADAVVQRFREAKAGLGVLGTNDSSRRIESQRTIGFSGWRSAFRDWYALLATDTQIAYWHPSVVDRINALDHDRGQRQIR